MTVSQLTDATAALSLKKQATKKLYIQIRDLLKAPNSDELLLDLAVLISERNVVFLRNQDITFEEQKEFADRLGRVTGKPATSGLHVHPSTAQSSELGDEALTISSEYNKKVGSVYASASEFQSQAWHSDITFEPIPSDYAILRLREVPPEGGDTLWASAYEIYDRLSPAFQKFLEGLTATHTGLNFKASKKPDLPRFFQAQEVHLKTLSVFAGAGFTTRINELSKDESDLVLKHIINLTVQNHDLHVRYRWGKHDVAVWDNRVSFHSATTDFDGDLYLRHGERATSLGERPYFDPNSSSRREALGIAPPPARRAHLASLADKSA
ncbi:taurine catabolism dioxygenase [Rhizoclosmatium globosum]|uniref:Taurine catabolism dioxygenase n=1 Tax=Rhizoclosmatium globosum TaxID=329046 RepID=A0A1Y2CE53_9FUNG|nr:taurine catabolism dioxygenase [Rhizoclosmatium globosum]|eukprot:ORY45167.1 taurine catabolism dioxygenase [Rhizoclosmatium globosum]